MKKTMIAATMAALATMACASAAMAQTANESAEGEEFTQLLEEDDSAAPDESAPAAGSPATEPSTDQAADTKPAESATAESREELDVIPLPQKPAAAASAAQPAPSRGKALEEIVVTAQRREESVQDVPISITVFNQEQLDNANITNAADIAAYTPSLSTNTRFGTETATFSLRGFTQDLRTTASVATYFAEVVAPRGQTVQTSGDGAGPGSFFDLQNVQVLKGPQGTLFGRNTTGGAVLLVPRKPADEFEGYAELSGGNLDALRGQAVVNVPVTDRLRLRFGIDANRREGYLDNYTGVGADHLGNVDYIAYRLSGVVDITDSLENYTILTYVDSQTFGQTAQLFLCNPNVQESPLSVLTGPACQRQLAHQAAIGRNGFYDVASTVVAPLSTIEEKRLINTTTWQAADDLTVKNIFAYAHLFTQSESGIFGTQFTETTAAVVGLPLPGGLVDPRRELAPGASIVQPGVPVTSQATWVEEIQVQGNAFDSRLIWQAGVYHENSRPDGPSGNRGWSFVSCEPASLKGDPSQFNCYDSLNGAIGGIIDQRYRTEYLNQAVYTQATFTVTDQVGVTAGIRYTWDKTEGHGTRTRYTFAQNQPLPPIESTLSPTAKSEAPTGLLELDYKPIEDVMLYGKYIRGYRQGSVNMAADPGIDSWDPEKVDTYEVGAKTSFGGWIPGRFNIAAFYNDLTDMQLQSGYVGTNVGTTTAIFNAGKARIAGAEIEAFLQVTDNLSASLSYAYLDTKLLEQEDRRDEVQAAGGPIAGLTYTPIADVGDTLPFAADHTYVVSLNYRLPLPERVGDLSLGTTYVYTGERRTGASSATPFSVLEPFSLLNLNFNWTGIAGSSFDLSAFATNVLEEEYATYYNATYNVLGFESRQLGQPRMIGARLKYNFGASAR